ncbi:hypothetical protein NDU88_008094 [Pleurodeles waltl]|uniref:Uncharacterized protein n=1 Tax=Pleurodeles waltl TaxID=8319 RepID=A0AAV7QMM5_PLEWA|nr:hypothetical protein NDU88_008094 [Pleurodeles waltl]
MGVSEAGDAGAGGRSTQTEGPRSSQDGGGLGVSVKQPAAAVRASRFPQRNPEKGQEQAGGRAVCSASGGETPGEVWRPMERLGAPARIRWWGQTSTESVCPLSEWGWQAVALGPAEEEGS